MSNIGKYLVHLQGCKYWMAEEDSKYCDCGLVGTEDAIYEQMGELQEGIKDAVGFIENLSLWEVGSDNTEKLYLKCRYCLSAYPNHAEDGGGCIVGNWLKKWSKE